MITETVKPTALKNGDWIRINKHEVSTILAVCKNCRTYIISLTNGINYYLDEYQSSIDRIVCL